MKSFNDLPLKHVVRGVPFVPLRIPTVSKSRPVEKSIGQIQRRTSEQQWGAVRSSEGQWGASAGLLLRSFTFLNSQTNIFEKSAEWWMPSSRSYSVQVLHKAHPFISPVDSIRRHLSEPGLMTVFVRSYKLRIGFKKTAGMARRNNLSAGSRVLLNL